MDGCTFEQWSHWLRTHVDELSAAQRRQMSATLQRGSLRQQTIAIIEAAAAATLACPRCGARRLHRDGHANGLQRYQCVRCGRTFNSLTGTPLARLRHKGKWLAYLDTMLDSATVRRAAARVEVHRNTSFRWRHRFLTWSQHDRQLPLRGIAEADETYLLESQKGARRLNRPPRRRGGVASRRGISSEHVCILVARDRAGRTHDAVTGRAPLRRADLTVHLASVLAPGCVLLTDGHPAYPGFARAHGVTHRAVNQSAGARVQGQWHVQNVNAYHSRFKQWLRNFHGVATRYLANYLGWRWAVDGARIATAEALLRSALAPPPPRI